MVRFFVHPTQSKFSIKFYPQNKDLMITLKEKSGSLALIVAFSFIGIFCNKSGGTLLTIRKNVLI